MGRNGLMVQRQHDFDQADDPSRGFEMADVTLHRANDQGHFTFAKNCADGVDLNRITQGGAGAVGIKITYFIGSDLGLL